MMQRIFARSAPTSRSLSRQRRQLILGSAIAAVAMLSACGGGGSGASSAPPVTVTPTPAPTPPPTPTPTPPPPPAFSPVAGQIFADVQNLQNLHVAGRAWTSDYAPDGRTPPTNIRDGGTLAVSYEAATNSYRLDAPSIGSGTLFQTGAPYTSVHGFGKVFPARLAADAAAAAPGSGASFGDFEVLKTRSEQNPFVDVAWIAWYGDREAGTNLRSGTIGVAGIARPSPAAVLPGMEARRYSLRTLAYIGGNFGDSVTGTGTFEVAASAGAMTGTVDLALSCFMGCAYPTRAAQLSSSGVAAGSTQFAGEFTVSGTSTRGTYQGIFAGPNANELLIAFEAPYFYPERSTWVTIRGVMLGRVI